MPRRNPISHPALLTCLLAVSGCRLSDQAHEAWLRLFPQGSACHYGDPKACAAEEECAFVRPGRAECVKRYAGSTPFLRFPFEPSHPVVCTQGNQGSAGGSHSFRQSLFALDLATPSESAAPGVIHSATDGTALVYRSCPDGKSPEGPGKAANDDPCGNGLGNHVRVLNPDGYLVLYAHMGAIWVEDGQPVHAGDPLGREGKSGKALTRHLQLSVHAAPAGNWLETLSYYHAHMGVVPDSIPFETQICDPAVKGECQRKRLRSEEMPCSSEAKHRPLLRADWRE